MAVNGAAAKLLPPASEPLSVPAQPFDERLGGIEGWVSAILVALADVNARALQELQEDGQVSVATRALGGDLIARLHKLQELSLGKLDFDDLVRREGRLRARHDADLDGVDEFTASILATLTRVTAALQAELN